MNRADRARRRPNSNRKERRVIPARRLRGPVSWGMLSALLVAGLFAQDKKTAAQEASIEDLLKEKVQTASKYDQNVAEAPASIAIVSAEDIKRYGYRTLDEIFFSLAGFYISYDRNYSYLGVRGFGRPTDYNNRILLLVNGLRMNETIFGLALFETAFGIDMADIERVEVIRGPGSSLYGTSAMLAVINVITKNGLGKPGLSVSAETGSYGRRKATASYGQTLKNGMDIFVSARWADIKGQNLYFPEYDTPETGHGVARDLDGDRFNGAFAAFEYKGFRFQGYSSRRQKDIPTGSWGVDFNAPSTYSLDTQRFLEFTYDRKISSKFRLTGRGYFNEYLYEETYPIDGIAYKDEAKNRLWGGEIKAVWDPASNNRLILGLEYRNNYQDFYRYSRPEFDYFGGNFPLNIYSFYGQDEWHLSRALSLTLGFRYDRYSTSDEYLAPRAAMVFHAARDVTFKLLYGEAFRAPSIYEKYYYDDTGNGGYKQKVNPLLTGEKIRTFELVVEHDLGAGLLGTISLYSFRMKGLIDLIQDSTDGFYEYKNIRQVEAAGFELGLRARLNNGWQGYANYSYQMARNESDDLKITNSPTHLAKAGLSFPMLRTFQLGVQALYESARRTVYGTKTDPFLLVHVNLVSKPICNHLGFSIRIINLFDQAYRYPGGLEHRMDAILQDGRHWIFRLEYTF
jgi:outer membrane receptor for ferrienterochelin and colicins